MPLNCSDDDFTWERDTADDNKYFYTVHSELNAILKLSWWFFRGF